MSGKRMQAGELFGLAANTLMVVGGILLFLSMAGKVVANMFWTPSIFFSVLKLPGTGLVGTVLASQALFSPLVVLVIMSLWLLALQAWCWFLVWPVTRGWAGRTRLLYFLISLIPIFGPAGAYSLMQTQEELEVD